VRSIVTLRFVDIAQLRVVPPSTPQSAPTWVQKRKLSNETSRRSSRGATFRSSTLPIGQGRFPQAGGSCWGREGLGRHGASGLFNQLQVGQNREELAIPLLALALPQVPPCWMVTSAWKTVRSSEIHLCVEIRVAVGMTPNAAAPHQPEFESARPLATSPATGRVWQVAPKPP